MPSCPPSRVQQRSLLTGCDKTTRLLNSNLYRRQMASLASLGSDALALSVTHFPNIRGDGSRKRSTAVRSLGGASVFDFEECTDTRRRPLRILHNKCVYHRALTNCK